jgi:phosphohistidine phosphatase
MEMFLVQHAPALAAPDEGARAGMELSERGRDRVVRLTRALDRLGVRFDRLYHGPEVRSLETANILAELLDGPSRVTPRLIEPPTEELRDELLGNSIAVVGHAPHVAALVSWLVHGDPDRRAAFLIKSSSVVWLSGEPGAGRMHLKALFPRRALRALAKS